MNKIILLGRLTKDVEVLKTQNDSLISKYTLAVPRKYAKEGEERKVDFINIVCFGKLAEFSSKFFGKGQQVLVTGRLEINQYEDENGEKKFTPQIIAEELDFADTKKESNGLNKEFDYENLYENATTKDNASDDLPF